MSTARRSRSCAKPWTCSSASDPPQKFPDGHPDLAGNLGNLGLLLKDRGEYGKAADALGDAQAMYDRLTATFFAAGAEAEALNLSASLPGTRNEFLAATAHVNGTDPAAHYSVLWRGKSALARAQTRRRRLLRAAVAANEDARKDFQKLIGVRQELARLILAPARPGDDDRAQHLQELTDRKERLEKELAGVLPASERETPPYTELADRLPDHAAFIDLYRYADLEREVLEVGRRLLHRLRGPEGPADPPRRVGRRPGHREGPGGVAGRHHQGLARRRRRPTTAKRLGADHQDPGR